MSTNDYLLLARAINDDDLETVDRLVSEGCDVGKIRFNMNFLHIAVYLGRYRIVEFLSRDKKHINTCCQNFCFPECGGFASLHFSCWKGNEKMTELLLSRGASLTVQAELGVTPLHVAVEREHPNIVNLLLKTNPDCVNMRDNLGRTALHCIIDNTSTNVIDVLLQYGAHVGLTRSNGRTVLMEACCKGNENIVRRLLENSTSTINNSDKQGRTALFMAAESGHIRIVKLLLNSNEIVDRYNQHKCHSCVHTKDTIKQEPDNLIQRLILNREQNNFCDMNMHILSCNVCSTKIDLLKKTAVNVNAVDEKRLTPLHVATQFGHFEIVRLLLKHGADARAKSSNDKTALHVAAENGFSEIVEQLLRSGAYIDLRAIHCCSSLDSVKVFKCFIYHGWILDSEVVCSIVDILRNRVQIILLFLCSGIRIKYLDNHYKNIHLPATIYNVVRYLVSWTYSNHPTLINTDGEYEMKFSRLVGSTNYLKTWFLQRFPRGKSQRFVINKFLNTCRKETEIMKNKSLGNTKLTMFDLVEADFNKLVKYLRSIDLVYALSKESDFSEFPVCREIIQIHVDRGLQRRLLLDECVKYFPYAYSSSPTLPIMIVETIFSMLANRDLNAFAFACNSLL